MINTVNASNMAGTYTIVVDDNLEIVSVTHNGELMTKMSDLTDPKFKPQHFEHVPGSDKVLVPPELKHGCVGFGSISDSPTEDPCRLLWGTWW
ncbi:MAG: hypothetical protein R6W88_16220 [Desulfobacterales bacterium]